MSVRRYAADAAQVGIEVPYRVFRDENAPATSVTDLTTAFLAWRVALYAGTAGVVYLFFVVVNGSWRSFKVLVMYAITVSAMWCVDLVLRKVGLTVDRFTSRIRLIQELGRRSDALLDSRAASVVSVVITLLPILLALFFWMRRVFCA